MSEPKQPQETAELSTLTTTVQREIHVAPCLECGHTDILLSDCNYSSFNQGGGECKKCGHKTYAGVDYNPTMGQMAAIWNAGNDIQTLIRAEEAKISESNATIQALRTKAVYAEEQAEAEVKARESAHRPGPWHISEHTDGRDALIYDADGFEVARVCYPNRDADAKLVASAPELLAAARAALHYMRIHKYADQSWADDLEAVISSIDGA